MSPIVKTANAHQTATIVSSHVPEFVRSDHPKFVTFIEKYYEFMANNSLMATTSNSSVYYYGADTASKILQDIKDVDKTDFDQFVESFRRQYGYAFPQDIYTDTNKATLYKNLVNFYQAVGTEDSFKMLFRLLYNEEIEIYYPAQDLLIASGGDWVSQSRIKVNYTDNLNLIENKKIVGANSGAYATVERVDILPPGSNAFRSGKIANSNIVYNSGVENAPYSESFFDDPLKALETGSNQAFVYLTDVFGKFDFHEKLYYSDGDVANTIVANTVLLPIMKRMLLFDSFSRYDAANSVVSHYDGRKEFPELSQYPPWGDANVIVGYANTAQTGNYIHVSNTGLWHTTGLGQGEIKIIANNVQGSYGARVLQVGNNTGASIYSDLRQLVYSKPIGIRGDNHLYRMTIRAKDLGGNSAHSVASGNRFSAGIVPLRHDRRILSAIDGYISGAKANTDNYDNPFWFVSHKQSIDDEFYVYTAYFMGRESKRSKGNPYLEKNYGSGGRTDLPSGDRYYNSSTKALSGQVRMPFNTTYILPTFKVNEPANGASFSQGVTQIDYISLEEMTPIQKQEGTVYGSYKAESSLLSGSSYLYDGNYWQQYAYDIRSKQQLKDYATVVYDSLHPAGMKMFGTKVSTTTSNVSVESIGDNINDAFTPDQLDSLSGWWRADAVGPQNIEYRRLGSSTSNGIYGTERNRFPAGFSNFEDMDENFGLRSAATLDVVAHGSSDVYIGNRSLKITDEHTSLYPSFDFPMRVLTATSPIFGTTNGFRNRDDDVHHPVIVEPNKKWLLSIYAKVSNTTSDWACTNSWGMYTAFGNTAGSDYNSNEAPITGNGSAGFAYWSKFDAEDTWQRMAMVVDLSAFDHTRIGFRFQLANRESFVEATGNTTYHFDGFMLEEYDPNKHGTVWGKHTPSPYVETGMSGSNVISWFDQSPNKHHVYAYSTDRFYKPQFVANAVGGKPAIRFSANTVKNTGNVYKYSSIGGSVNSHALDTAEATNFKPPTSGFQSKLVSNSSGGFVGGTLASPSLERPVTNTWTIMAVVKSNLDINSASYGTSNPTIINSGYAGNFDAQFESPSAAAMPSTGTLNLGYRSSIDDNGALRAAAVNTSLGLVGMESKTTTTFTHESPKTSTSFRIVGVSVNATAIDDSKPDDILNFHIDGRRFANNEIQTNHGEWMSQHSGLVWHHQNNYVTSIGKWRAANTSANSTADVTSVYQYGTNDWDGDIAEILVFNEKLSNTSIAKVEGYLAHKYSLQSNLKHKDDDGNGGPVIDDVYRWEFANTQDGWDFSTNAGDPTIEYVWENGDANGYIDVTAPAGSAVSLTMSINTAVYIDASAYTRFGIRFKTVDAPTTGYGRLSFQNSDGTYQTLGPVSGHQLGSTVTSVGWHEHYIDVGDHANWTGKITKLVYLFDIDTNGQQSYHIDWVAIAGNNHPHPYRWNAPTQIGANGWNSSY